MSLGTILYYILWPIVFIGVITVWLFQTATFLMQIGIEFARGFHEEIKKI